MTLIPYTEVVCNRFYVIFAVLDISFLRQIISEKVGNVGIEIQYNGSWLLMVMVLTNQIAIYSIFLFGIFSFADLYPHNATCYHVLVCSLAGYPGIHLQTGSDFLTGYVKDTRIYSHL